MRNLKTFGLVFAMYVIAIISETILYSTSPTYEGGISIIVMLALIGFVASKVGYRWFDCFFALLPFYGIFFIFRIAHRLAFLPNRDWAERA